MLERGSDAGVEMNPVSPSRIRTILDRLDIHPSKALGQNFLADANIRKIIMDTLGPEKKDSVLEIGPGLGVLTDQLIDRCAKIFAVEKDRRLYGYLKEKYADEHRVELECADFLDLDIREFMSGIYSSATGGFKLLSNLPYSSGSRILMEIARCCPGPERLVVTVQSEVAERITAPPGGKKRGLLSVWCGLTFSASKAGRISPTCFFPRPEVQSNIVLMQRLPERKIDMNHKEEFFRLTKSAFLRRRKKLMTTIRHMSRIRREAADKAETYLSGSRAGINARPEDLSVDEWIDIAKIIAGLRQ